LTASLPDNDAIRSQNKRTTEVMKKSLTSELDEAAGVEETLGSRIVGVFLSNNEKQQLKGQSFSMYTWRG